MKIEVMKNIYKFLQQYATDDDFAAIELKDTPCVMVDTGHLMVTPAQVRSVKYWSGVTNLNDNW